MNNRTFAIIKPDAVKNQNTGKIFTRILEAGFTILGAKLLKMTKKQAEGFYMIHKEKPFFDELTEFMSSGQSMVLVLEKENAVANWRDVIGATNPQDAKVGTIRKEFALSMTENSAHGSDSKTTAAEEIGFFFSKLEILKY